jgi:hypothetical protein
MQDDLYRLRSETQQAFDEAKALEARWKVLEREQRELHQVNLRTQDTTPDPYVTDECSNHKRDTRLPSYTCVYGTPPQLMTNYLKQPLRIMFVALPEKGMVVSRWMWMISSRYSKSSE